MTYGTLYSLAGTTIGGTVASVAAGTGQLIGKTIGSDGFSEGAAIAGGTTSVAIASSVICSALPSTAEAMVCTNNSYIESLSDEELEEMLIAIGDIEERKIIEATDQNSK